MNTVNPGNFQITRDTLDSVNPNFLTSFKINFTDGANFDTSEEIDLLYGSYMPCGEIKIDSATFTPSLSNQSFVATDGKMTFASEDVPDSADG